MKNVIVYVNGGYRLDNGYGKFVNNMSWKALRDAEMYCNDNGIEYYVA